MLNIASVNMPKIKSETKVLIIRTLKSQSPAEVADIVNVSKQQVERICQRYQETGDVHDRPRLGRPCKTTARDDSLPGPCQPPHSSRRSGRQQHMFCHELYVGSLLTMVSTVVLLPRNQR